MNDEESEQPLRIPYISYPMKQEYIEAANDASNKELNELIKTFSDKDKKKVEIIMEAINLMKNNNIIFYLFPYLPSYNPKENSLWTIHSFSKFIKYDKAGNLTEESRKLLVDINTNLQATLYNIFSSKQDGSFEQYAESIAYCCEYTNNRLNSKEG